MKQAVQPYLNFRDNCMEAMQFYQKIFGGELNMMKVSESPVSSQFPAEVQHQVLHSSLKNDDFFLMASDQCGMGEHKPGSSIEMNLNCLSEDEMKQLYHEISEGGQIIEEMKEQFWGDLFAMVIDRFDIRWMLTYTLKEKEQ